MRRVLQWKDEIGVQANETPAKPRTARLTPDERRQRSEKRLEDKLACDPVARRKYYRAREYVFADEETFDLTLSLVAKSGVTEFDPMTQDDALPVRELMVALALAGFQPEDIADAVDQPLAIVESVLMLHGEYRPWWAYRFLRRGELRISAYVGKVGMTTPCMRTFIECYGDPATNVIDDNEPTAHCVATTA